MKTTEYYDCNNAPRKRKMTNDSRTSRKKRDEASSKAAVMSAYQRVSKALLSGRRVSRRAFSAWLSLTRNALRRPTRWRLAIFSCSLLLSACGLNTPEPTPPPGQLAIEINRQQSLSVDRIDTLSVIVRGSPDDADREVLRLANLRGAQYYRIVSRTESEKLNPGVWRAFAVLYRQPAAQRP